MEVNIKTFFWLIPLCVIAGMAFSLSAVYLLSKLLGFAFDAQLATIIGVLGAAGSGTIVSAVILTWGKE